jgi:hypothetical protein
MFTPNITSCFFVVEAGVVAFGNFSLGTEVGRRFWLREDSLFGASFITCFYPTVGTACLGFGSFEVDFGFVFSVDFELFLVLLTVF